MDTRADGVRIAYPLFHAGGSGETPTSALQLLFHTIDLPRAKNLNRLWHSRFPSFGGGGSRICHSAEFEGVYYAVAIWTNPSAAKLPQRTWLMLKRWAIADDAPKNTASRMMSWMVRDIRKRLPEVETLVSYSDPDTHDGAIYKACGWVEGETTKRTTGSKQWHNRERGKRSQNQACERVTRWTRRLKPEVQVRQLHNQHSIDIQPGELGVTVRRGTKWADAKPGEELELCTGKADDQKPVGRGVVKEVVCCGFFDIPARLIEIEHEAASRLYSGLLSSMRRAYGPKFDENETVVVMTYQRTV